MMPGDPEDVFGDPDTAADGWCQPLGMFDFLSEGDNVAYNSLLHTGIEAPENPDLGGWGGRCIQVISHLCACVRISMTLIWRCCCFFWDNLQHTMARKPLG